MPPLGNPSAISYSTSSARSDLKEFTSPMAAYNFRMRAICDVSDIRTFLRLMLMAHSGVRLMLMAHPTHDLISLIGPPNGETPPRSHAAARPFHPPVR